MCACTGFSKNWEVLENEAKSTSNWYAKMTAFYNLIGTTSFVYNLYPFDSQCHSEVYPRPGNEPIMRSASAFVNAFLSLRMSSQVN